MGMKTTFYVAITLNNVDPHDEVPIMRRVEKLVENEFGLVEIEVDIAHDSTDGDDEPTKELLSDSSMTDKLITTVNSLSEEELKEKMDQLRRREISARTRKDEQL